ncbi:hypothetical protein F5B21DRAFT_529364 [Xylaria acuta]|nr:hypothetical protein F5B21DRAFT_529364 [Xylaria acuta]
MSTYTNGHVPGNNDRLEPIAVIGSSCRFPGGATSSSKLWDLLKSPRDVLKEIPSSRFNAPAFYHENGEYHGSSNVKHSYLLEDDHRHFDHRFFNISPKEAESMDPQQRLLLETVYEGVESAGYSINQLKGSPTAVFVGQMGGDYRTILLRDVDNVPQYFATGVSTAIMSNRVSYFFDWRGPSATIDTACSSSMVALHQAVQSLRSGESKLAVAAGVNLLLGPEEYIAESKLHMLSSTGRCRMWDSEVDGYGRGEGFAALLLKPLRQAIADNDHIECLIRNTGVNQDGRTKGITMPSATAQAALIKSTYVGCGLDLNREDDRPQYFEAHGTGTPTGDPIEAEAIQTTFFPEGSNPFGHKLYVGSIKTIIGHLEGTAGLAGVLKVALAMQNGIIPPNMHFNELNPRVRPFYSHLRIPTEPTVWPARTTGVPKRASVNSFGFGGTNAHAIIESWEPKVMNREHLTAISTSGPFVLSAESSASLISSFKAFHKHLEEEETIKLEDLEYTLSRRGELPWKASFSGNSRQQLLEKLERAIDTSAVTRATAVTDSLPPRILGIFTGQGAQWPAMGLQLYIHSVTFRKSIHDLEDSLKTLPDPPSWSLSEQLAASGSAARVHEASISQPLCTALQIALVDLFATAGVTFSAVVGHSSGEMGAAYAAGYLSAQDAIRIAYFRGVYAHQAEGYHGQKGAMMAVGMSFEDASQLCEDFAGKIVVAASNAKSSVTLSGDLDGINEAKRVLDERKIFARILKVDTAYHSHHMKPCAAPYLESLRKCNIQVLDGPRTCNWYSSVHGPNGRSIDDLEALKGNYWVENMTQPVLFSQAVHRAVGEEHCYDIALEVGPHPALQSPTLETIKALTGLDMPYFWTLKRGEDDMNAVADALGFVWKNFISPTPFINFEGFRKSFDKERQCRILKDLPSYCWDHDKVLFRESRKSKAFRTRTNPIHELLGTASSNFNGNNEQEVRWHQIMKLDELEWLRGHVFQRQVLFPAAGYVAMAFEASTRLAGELPIRLIELLDLSIHRAITLPDNSTGTEVTFIIRVNDRRQDQITAEYSCYSCDADAASGPEILNFTGRALLTIGNPSRTSLPTRSDTKLPMMPVDVERFYSHLAELGLDYSGDFRVRSVERRLNHSTIIANRILSSSLRVHPMSLDAAFHSLFAAHSWPGDGRMWTTYLPTSIKRVRINFPCPDLLHSSDHAASGMLVDCKVTSAGDKTISGNINIFCTEDGHPEMQINGFTCSSFSQPGPRDDRKLYSKTIWTRDISYGVEQRSNEPVRPDSDHTGLVEICERSAFFYCRRLRNEICPEERDSMEWHMNHLVYWIFDHLLPNIEAGHHPHIRREWASDTQEMVDEWRTRNPESVDLELIATIGEALPSILRGTISALQLMMERNMLYRFYAEGLGFREGNQDLTLIVSQLAHRYPRMNILEIGAGTGGATTSILNSISSNFLSYTYTDISAGFFEMASKIFKDYENEMLFKVLDIAKDPTTQGFGEYAYDLIIASNVLHATECLTKTIQNCRRLLKPGGYLVMLEITGDHLRPQFIVSSLKGWFLGVDDGRIWAPTVTEARWDSILREAGFSGVDFSVNSGFSVMTTQAVDDRVLTLRKPLSIINDDHRKLPMDNLVILGGRGPEVTKLVYQIRDYLLPHASRITHIRDLEDFDKQAPEVPMGTALLCLRDLEEPVFRDMNKKRFQALQAIFRTARHILWVTRGCREDIPEANMIVGLGRSLLQEFLDLHLQFIDIAPKDVIAPIMLSETMLRLVYSSIPEFHGIHWTAEHELAIEDGVLYIPRIVSNETLNDRLNSTRRTINQQVRIDETPTELVYSKKGGVLVQSMNKWPPPLPVSGQYYAVQVAFSSAFPFQLPDGRSVFFSIGSMPSNNREVLVMSERNSSVLRITKDEILDWKHNQHDAAWLGQFVTNILAGNILHGIEGPVWIHEPHAALINPVLNVSRRCGVNVTFTTSLSGSDPRLQFIHPCISGDDLQSVTPQKVKTFINMQPEVCLSLGNLIRSSLGATVTTRDFFADANDQKSLTLYIQAADLCHIAKALLEKPNSSANGETVVPIQDIKSPVNWQPTTIIQWTASDTVTLNVNPIDHQGMFSAQKTYLLVGLTGDLGLSICQWMIDHGARHLVIASRNPKVDPSIREFLERKGARILIRAVDISDKLDLERMYRDISVTMPPIGGVANGAMVLQDKPFDNMVWEDFKKVLKPKVQGSRNLDELFYSTDLEFFILFSSLASIVGNKGQSNYGAANMFMTSLAHQRRKRGVAASVIHIAMLLGVGYISRFGDKFQDQLKKDRIMALSEIDFHDLFAEAILTGRPELHQDVEIITGIRKDTEASWSVQPRFSAYINKRTSARETRQQKSGGDVRSILAGMANGDEAVGILIEEFSKTLQNMLQINADKIDKRSPLMNLGVDSLVAVQVRTWFLKELNVDVPVLRVLSDASVQDICKEAFAKLHMEKARGDENRVEDNDSPTAKPSAKIDWNEEIHSLFANITPSFSLNVPRGANYATAEKKGLSIVLTGATGFVGTHILRRLTDDPRVSEIHCIAIRPDSQGVARHVSIQSSRIFEYSGSLIDELFGLSESDYLKLTQRADAIVHNAAEVNFLKSYGALKAVNVISTMKLAQLALARSIPMHLVSTAAVSSFAKNKQLPEISPKGSPPYSDGSLGYAASKWACEVLLERVAEQYHLPVFVHRAVIILGQGAPDTDLMTVVDKYSRELQALPRLDDKLVDGVLDIVEIEEVVSGITNAVMASRHSNGTSHDTSHYVVMNYCNEEKVEASELKKYYEKRTGTQFIELPMETWLDKAVGLGLSPMVDFFLRESVKSGGPIRVPSLRKGIE